MRVNLEAGCVFKAGGSAGAATKAAESLKHLHNDTKCSELGWQCIPLAVENMEWDEKACNAFSYIATQEAILTNCSKSQVLEDLCIL